MLVGEDIGGGDLAVGVLGGFGDKGTSASSQKEEPALVFGLAELRLRRKGRFLEDMESDEGCSYKGASMRQRLVSECWRVTIIGSVRLRGGIARDNVYEHPDKDFACTLYEVYFRLFGSRASG